MSVKAKVVVWVGASAAVFLLWATGRIDPDGEVADAVLRALRR